MSDDNFKFITFLDFLILGEKWAWKQNAVKRSIIIIGEKKRLFFKQLRLQFWDMKRNESLRI